MQKFINLLKEHNSEFETYFNMLVSYNEKVNLTAITEKGDVFTKHFLDSLLAVDEIKQNSSVVDVGTGAGFPSLPIKIVRPDINLTMVDSLNKRVLFLNEVCQTLNVKTKIFHSRAEDFAQQHKEIFDVATARAVARLNTLLEYLLPLIKVGGIVIAYKGSNFEEELIESKNALAVLGGKHEKTLNFKLPNNAGERNIIIIRKVKSTPNIYPRGQNKPKINPIV